MPSRIGFYVHHHGRGHANRARQIIPHLAQNIDVTIFSSSVDYLRPIEGGRVQLIELPLDIAPEVQENNDIPEVFHYAPLNVPGIRQRMFHLAEWVRTTEPQLLVVDVSVEIALFARLLSVPTVIMRQNGWRCDLPHQSAFQSAQGLLAPYAATLEEESTADWIQDKTFYSGGFSRYAQRTDTKAVARRQLGMRSDLSYAIVMSGLGGKGNSLSTVVQAAIQCPAWEWWVVGPSVVTQGHLPDNLNLVGQVSDTYPYLLGADAVVASAGNNTVMEIATAGSPYICIPEERPFQEQVGKAKALARLNAAIVLAQWPEVGQWADLLEQVQHTDPQALTDLIDADGAKKCAQYITQQASSNQNPAGAS